MTTRFHFQASGAIAAPNNPSFDANWEQTGQATRLPMDVNIQKSANTALANSSAITVPITTTQQILCYQFTSNQVFTPVRLDASVTVSMIIRVLESATTANVFLAYILRAFSADGLTALGTLASSMTNAGTEFGTTASTRIFSSVALTATTISQPWRLVLDLGGHAQAPTAARSYTMRAGCSAASDFALTSGLTTDLNPWLQLSVDLQAVQLNNYQGMRVRGMSVGEDPMSFPQRRGPYFSFARTSQAAGFTVALNQVQENDTAQAIAWAPKRRLVNQANEQDSAQAITKRKTLALGQASETNTAQAITQRKTRAVAQVSENDSAQTISRPRIVALAQASEQDLAQAVSRPKIVALAQASEQDSSQTIISRKQKTVAQASEQDSAQAFTRRKTATVTQAQEQDAAQSVTSRKTAAVAQASEQDAAQAVAVNPQRRLVGQSSEQDAAQAVTWAPKARLVNQANEQDAAQAVSWSPKRRLLNQVQEQDAAQTITYVAPNVVLQVQEQDAAQVFSINPYRRLVLQVSEQDAAQSFSSRKLKTLAQANEQDAAQQISSRKLKAVAQVQEQDASQSISTRRAYALNQASEQDTAQGLTSHKYKTLAQVLEQDASQSILPRRLYSLAQTQEQDSAQAVAHKQRLLNQAQEQDAAQQITPPVIELGQAIEHDEAQPFHLFLDRLVTQAQEQDSSQLILVRKQRIIGLAFELDLAQTILGLIINDSCISQQHYRWLEAIARAHGLIDPLTVTNSGDGNGTRSDGTLIQTFNGGVLSTLQLPAGAYANSIAKQEALIEALARIHGLVAPLSVSATQRTDGTLVQNITSDDTEAVYTRVA